MSFSGRLEDVIVADLLQFVQMGRRSGTLVLRRADETAEIAFHLGSIVNARLAGTPRLGALLVASGALSTESLEKALQTQLESVPRASLGQILVEDGLVAADVMYAAVREQFAEVVRAVLGWREGYFEFLLDDIRPVDELAVHPGDLVPQVHIDTQCALLDALRVMDEQKRDDPADPRREMLSLVAAEPQPAAPVKRPRVHVVSSDQALVDELSAALGQAATVVRVQLRDAGTSSPTEAPLVVIDVRCGAGPADVLALRRSRPRARVVVLSGGELLPVDAYAAGAIACVPPEPGLLAACVRSLLAIRGEQPGREDARRDLHRLRRVLGDLHSGLITTSITLSLMNIISESVERAVLFLATRDELVALGAFGAGAAGRPLAELTQGLRLPVDPRDLIGECLARRRARRATSRERLPPRLGAILGRPRTGQLAVLPVHGGQRVVAVVYVDNGARDRPLDELEMLEMASAQAGLAFENELLRRRVGPTP